jgi:hypothetical protein
VSSTPHISLLEQRQNLRLRLQAQRQVIARQLEPDSAVSGSYPRSRTMRFLTQRPALIIRVLAGLAAVLRATW